MSGILKRIAEVPSKDLRALDVNQYIYPVSVFHSIPKAEVKCFGAVLFCGGT